MKNSIYCKLMFLYFVKRLSEDNKRIQTGCQQLNFIPPPYKLYEALRVNKRKKDRLIVQFAHF